MKKRKKDPSTIGLNSPQVEGQGTTTTEFDGKSASSARRKTKKQDV
ncbi:YuzL family protein [Cytobacillus spongiae]|nr:YuzL family protein [Cytobacillus spongiae]UII54283.1 YuzL family protein [Cytobacillus spongiae]